MRTLDSWRKEEARLRALHTQHFNANQWPQMQTIGDKLRRTLNKIAELSAADTMLPEAEAPKQIESVLPDIIRILDEGDAATRVARFLVDNGWTQEDAWREVKKVSASEVFTSALVYAVKDVIKGDRWSREHEWADSFRQDLKIIKKRGRLEPLQQ